MLLSGMLEKYFGQIYAGGKVSERVLSQHGNTVMHINE
jgi:hypothetical protein